ncbi:MAG: AAA domain-containing protein [Clostridiaceae bacterium]|nr:AAA domain-containing protein [Clostridiaceae bacterium]
MSEIYHRSAFKNWVSAPDRANGNPIPPDLVDEYVNALKFSSSMLISGKFKHTDLFFYSTPKEFEEAVEVILSAKNFNLINKSTKGAFAEALDYYLQFLGEIAQPLCWLFSGNPRIYDIISAIQELSVIPWKLDKADPMIKRNDRVFLWIPGVDGGIAASGTILGSPENHEPLRNDPFAVGAFLRLNSFLGVDIRIDKRYTKPLVSRNLLAADDIAKTLEVLNFPGVPFYKVSPEQEQAIDGIIENSYTRAPASPATSSAATRNTASSTAKTASASSEAKTEEKKPSRETPSSGETKGKDLAAPELSSQDTKESVDQTADEEPAFGRRYWIYTPADAARVWDDYYSHGYLALGFDALGDLKQFSSREAIKKGMQASFGSGRNYKYLGYAAWQFCREMQIGDIVYFGSGPQNILGRGIVKSDYTFDWSRKDHKNVRDIAWTNRGEWSPNPVVTRRTLVDITNLTGYCRTLEDLISDSSDANISEDYDTDYISSYSKNDFLTEAFMEENEYEELKYLLLSRKNVVITGVPGVGKTFLAERLAYSIIGGRDSDRVKTIQFHSGYSYENFVMGYAPDAHDSRLSTGVFYDFCKEAEPDDKEYFFIIDDISRGDIGNIFGDLLMLVGRDDRGKKIRLLHRDEQFAIPDNVHIIATMNGASESSGMDYSVRRRFAFYQLSPAFDKKPFIDYVKKQSSPKLEKLTRIVSDINKALASDSATDGNRAIGHGYFCGKQELSDINLNAIAKYELIPLVRELFASNPDQAKTWVGKLVAAIKS